MNPCQLQAVKYATGLPAFSDSAWPAKKCHCKRVSLYPMIFSIMRSFFGPENCHCSQSVTQTGVTVNGEACTILDRCAVEQKQKQAIYIIIYQPIHLRADQPSIHASISHHLPDRSIDGSFFPFLLSSFFLFLIPTHSPILHPPRLMISSDRSWTFLSISLDTVHLLA